MAALLFVLIWSTGFVIARGVGPDADPQLFLLVRILLVALLAAALATATRKPWPTAAQARLHIASGMLLPGVYLCAGWWAVSHGVPAGVMALLGGLQPLAIALAGTVTGRERAGPRVWSGLAIGALGVVLVLAPAIGGTRGAVPPIAAAAALASVFAISAATMIQRARLAGDALLPAAALQNGSGALVALGAVTLLGTPRWNGTVALYAMLAWSVVGLSLAALSILAWMLRTRGATTVSSLLLLVPPLAAIETWLLFEERLTIVQIAGFAFALGGVALARAPAAAEPG